MADSLIGPIVHIDKPWFPVRRQLGCINGISMVLRSYIASVGTYHPDRLVVTAVTVFEFVCRGTGRLGKQLVTHADTEDRGMPLHCLE